MPGLKITVSLVITAVFIAANIYHGTTFDLDLFKECYASYIEVSCSARHLETLLKRMQGALACGNLDIINSFAVWCTKNQQGDRCGASLAYSGDLIRVLTVCYSSFAQSSNCTDNCKSAIMKFRDDLGCCINDYFNFTGSITYTFAAPMFANSFWSAKCGIPSVPPNCGAENRIAYVIPSNASCGSREDSFKQYWHDYCSPSSMNTARMLWQNLPTECQRTLESFRTSQCTRNNDNYCIPTSLTDYTKYIEPITMHCRSGQTCSSECKASLDSFQSDRGCCINSLYNSTYGFVLGTNSSLFSNQRLFQSCNVTAPPLTCAADATTSGGNLQLETAMYLLLLLLAMSLFGI